MDIFAEHGSNSETKSQPGPPGVQGLKGLPDLGFKLDSNSNFDIDNKKLTNVKNGDDDHDVMVKSQIEEYFIDKTKYLDGVLPAQVLKNKAVIYSPFGSVHGNALYLKDQYVQEVHFFHRKPTKQSNTIIHSGFTEFLFIWRETQEQHRCYFD